MAAGKSLLGDCHDVLKDSKFRNSYHNSIGLSVFSPPYGGDAISKEGQDMTVIQLRDELHNLLADLSNSNVWIDNHLVVIEVGVSTFHCIGQLVTNYADEISQDLDNVSHITTIPYEKTAWGLSWHNYLMVYCLHNHSIHDRTAEAVASLQQSIHNRPRGFGGFFGVYGQKQYQYEVNDVISNKHFMSGLLVDEIVSKLGCGVVADWYAGSNLTGAVASYRGFEWVAIEKNPLQFLNQYARFDKPHNYRILLRDKINTQGIHNSELSYEVQRSQTYDEFCGYLLSQINPNFARYNKSIELLLTQREYELLQYIYHDGVLIEQQPSTGRFFHAVSYKDMIKNGYFPALHKKLANKGCVTTSSYIMLTQRGYNLLQLFDNVNERQLLNA